MRIFLISTLMGLTLIGCASTKTELGANVRPAQITNNEIFDLQGLQQQASVHYEQADYEKALNAYQYILVNLESAAPQKNEMLLAYGESALGFSQRDQQYLTEAKIAFDKLDGEDGLSEPLQNRLIAGKALLALLDGQAADDVVEQGLIGALVHKPDDLRLRNALGRFYDERQSWLEALDVYVGALGVAALAGGETAPIINNIGMSLLMQGRTKEALEKFEQAYLEKPTQAVFDNNRRMALVLLGRDTQAFDGLETSLAARLYNDVGYIAAAQGERDKARRYYKKAIALSPEHFELAKQNLAALNTATLP